MCYSTQDCKMSLPNKLRKGCLTPPNPNFVGDCNLKSTPCAAAFVPGPLHCVSHGFDGRSIWLIVWHCLVWPLHN